ncbi:class I SAM-dependent methyltransferase [Micromonospora sp. NBC_01699]|uniref:class I SAM-dependent methyltransferase n=1 Tax=Micromonospora sp. NBC_01699 TaxID=2975984 RepID=UPI002E2B379C|nr:class I SAM-dependent methyltransferase [Micromonospora sp. NBC_01699]
MTRDWQKWHDEYDEPNSPLAHRLRVVRRDLRRALAEAPCGTDGVQQVVSICAGEGRDVLPVLAEQDEHRRVRVLLVELDPVLAQRARTTAADLGLSGVEVRVADAGAVDTYLDVPPAHLLLACGVFGNISAADTRQTVATLPALLAPGAIVIWTRAGRDGGDDPSQQVRADFRDHGFTELSFTSATESRFRVGMNKLDTPAATRAPQAGTRMFTFR